jgi:hypothetical protein
MLTPEELLGGAVVRSPGKRLDKDAGGSSADRFFDSRLEKEADKSALVIYICIPIYAGGLTRMRERLFRPHTLAA